MHILKHSLYASFIVLSCTVLLLTTTSSIAQAGKLDSYCSAKSMFKNNLQKTYWVKRDDVTAGKVRVFKSNYKMSNGLYRYCVDFKSLLQERVHIDPNNPALFEAPRAFYFEVFTKRKGSTYLKSLDPDKYKIRYNSNAGPHRVGTLTVEPGKERCMAFKAHIREYPHPLPGKLYAKNYTGNLWCN